MSIPKNRIYLEAQSIVIIMTPTPSTKKPWIIFDLDHTLFDTTEFKKEIFAVFKACSVDEAIAKSSFDAFTKGHEGNYDMLAHCEELLKKKHIRSLDKVIAFLKSPLEKHLIKDVEETLHELRARGHRLILLTKGIERFQLTKIQQAGITSSFDEIRIVYRLKEEELRKLALPKGSYFVNDNWQETERIMNAYPALHYVLFAPSHKAIPQNKNRVSFTIVQELHQILELVSQISHNLGTNKKS